MFTTRGSEFFTAGMFATIRRWDTLTGKEAGQMVGHKAAIKTMALNGLGDMLASGGQDGTIIFWEWILNKKIIELKQHKDEVTSLAFSHYVDGQTALLVSGSLDRTICIWDADNQQLRKQIDAGCGVLAVAISQDNKKVFAAGDDNLIRVWEVKSGKLLQTLRGHTDMVVSLALGATTKIVDDEPALDRGKLLVSGGRDKAIRVWKTDDLAAPPRIIPRHLGDSDALTVSRDGKHMATAGLNGTIRIFETATGKELFTDGNPQAPLAGLTRSPDGKTLAAVTAPGIVYMWNAQTGQQLMHFATGHTGDVVLAFTPNGDSLVTGGRRHPLLGSENRPETGRVAGRAGRRAVADPEPGVLARRQHVRHRPARSACAHLQGQNDHGPLRLRGGPAVCPGVFDRQQPACRRGQQQDRHPRLRRPQGAAALREQGRSAQDLRARSRGAGVLAGSQDDCRGVL